MDNMKVPLFQILKAHKDKTIRVIFAVGVILLPMLIFAFITANIIHTVLSIQTVMVYYDFPLANPFDLIVLPTIIGLVGYSVAALFAVLSILLIRKRASKLRNHNVV